MGRKSQEEKEFLIAQRRRTGPGMTNVPVWIMQKAGKRIYNTKAKRHWRETSFGALFRASQKAQGLEPNQKPVKSGHKKKSAKLAIKKFRNTWDSK